MSNHPENNLCDRDLVARTLNGDAQAFAAIIRKTETLVSQIVFKMIDHAEDRKDLAQDIYLKTYKNLSRFRFESKLSTWIASIAYNTCLNHLEKEKLRIHRALPDLAAQDGQPMDGWTLAGGVSALDDPQTALQQKEMASLLWNEVSRLEPVYRTLIGLFHQEGLNYEEIAGITSMPVGTVKSYLFRARRMLRNRLTPYYKNAQL